jgi:membrane associated rhomboid family serine protease
MTAASVGLRCPDHAGARAQSAGRPLGSRTPRIMPRAAHLQLGGTDALVTKALIALNVVVYLIGAVQGGGINNPMPPSILANSHAIYPKLWLDAPQLAQGDWWRLITTMFLHESLVHIGFNMLALWWIGAPVEKYLGRARYLGVYFVAGLAGSAGALIQTPGITVGASGAIFGILGAMLILEWQATGRFGGNALTLIVINLALSFTLANISIGGHIGGLVGGILATLAFARWGRGHAAYGRIGLGGVLGLVIIAGVSVGIAYWQVRGYA